MRNDDYFLGLLTDRHLMNYPKESLSGFLSIRKKAFGDGCEAVRLRICGC